MSESPSVFPSFPKFSNWKGISEYFPVQKESVWLNYCGTTPMSTYAIEMMNAYFLEYAKFGIFAPNFSEPQIKKEIRNYLSQILHCDPSEIGIVHNTSEGMNFYSHSIQIPKGKRILVLENEYPSNVYPWEHWQSKGVSLSFVKVGKTPDEFLENLKFELNKNDVYLLSLSPVHWCTGVVFDMDAVSKLCETYNTKLVIDGSQAVGHIPLDFSKTKVAFCAFAAWKWLLGPLGLGVIYISKEESKGFQLVFKGQASVVNDSNYFPYRDEWKPAAEQFEQSTINFNDWIYFFASLRMLSTLGFDRVQERIYEVAGMLKDILHELGFTLESDLFPHVKTGILAITGHKNPNQFQPEAIQAHLKGKGIITAVRLGRLRMAPHIGIEGEHIQRVKTHLQTYLDKL
ncbi:aminotransferase, class V [Leptospira yanagawae serovar Saopaulo str. Sao Paulo = ATCC 700523]|uniref:Aminotransferase, class V n=1 Tax=Leptospira yanagawae serovar Saopaulo str. Sao Paulo = ATCC 700523 TaxID=1249483 RepID=A0A5E8H828_9LEPT|nr:aminotransferase class V-fold PLP-dependent enzyme [Leptospira yanagawae]EOQ86992.1 aminotransferase, class V [Leptospira yanagawae serovar Saopaulo str. Sao Paulo = ATCC 700523]